MNTKNNEERANTPNERDERYATGNTASDKRSGSTQGGYREWSDNWNETKAKLQKNYSQLTDNDLRYENGKEDELVTRLSQKLGRTPDDTRKLLQDSAGTTGEARKGQEPGSQGRSTDMRGEDRSATKRDQDRTK